MRKFYWKYKGGDPEFVKMHEFADETGSIIHKYNDNFDFIIEHDSSVLTHEFYGNENTDNDDDE